MDLIADTFASFISLSAFDSNEVISASNFLNVSCSFAKAVDNLTFFNCNDIYLDSTAISSSILFVYG